jgi:chromate transporter
MIAVFLLFSKIGVSSFGGAVSVRLQEELVRDRGWLAEREFSAAFALARIMPGANIINLAALIGHRLMGLRGATAAVLGLLIGPCVVVIGLARCVSHFRGPALDAGLEGMAASAAGLLIGMGLRSGSRILRIWLASPSRRTETVGAVAVLVAMVVLIGALRFPTALAVLCLAPVSSALAFFGKNIAKEGANNGR